MTHSDDFVNTHTHWICPMIHPNTPQKKDDHLEVVRVLVHTHKANTHTEKIIQIFHIFIYILLILLIRG